MSKPDEPPTNSHEPRGGPQFPNTVEGQLARVFKQDWLNHQRIEEINELTKQVAEQTKRLADQAAAMRELQEHKDETTATAVAAAIEAVFRQLHLFKSEVDQQPEEEREDRCPGGYPEWQTWKGFRDYMVEREERLNLLKLGKGDVAELIGCDPKTISRAMFWHGLRPKQWPPSTWPLKAPPRPKPKPKPKTNSVTITDLHPALVAIGLGYAFIDIATDGKLNGVVRLLHACGIHVLNL